MANNNSLNPTWTYGNITVNSLPTTGNVITATTTTSTSNYAIYNGGAGSISPTWTLASPASGAGMTVKGVMEADDVKINGVSMKEMMQSIQDRLAILVPDPAKLEKFAALKAAYEHYQLLEKLCTDTPNDNNK